MPQKRTAVKSADKQGEGDGKSNIITQVFGKTVGTRAIEADLSVWDMYELYDTHLGREKAVEKIDAATKTAAPGATRLGRFGFLSTTFGSPDFDRMVTAEIRDNSLKLEGPQLYEGMMSCRRKGCTGIVRSQSRQTRAADEAIPLDNTCYKCGEHWLTG